MQTTNSRQRSTPEVKTRIVVLGGGFGGVATARHLEAVSRFRPDIEITFVSRDSWASSPRLRTTSSGSIRASVGVRIVLDWTVALFFRPDITKIDLQVEQEQVRQARGTAKEPMGGVETRRSRPA